MASIPLLGWGLLGGRNCLSHSHVLSTAQCLTEQVVNKCRDILGLERPETRLPEVARQAKRLVNYPMQNDIYTRSRDKTIMKGMSGYHGDPILPEQKHSQDFIKTPGK